VTIGVTECRGINGTDFSQDSDEFLHTETIAYFSFPPDSLSYVASA
jgi:hypothetical protein